MTRLLWLWPLLIALMAVGCVNKRGISATYYNDCHEYYDVHGYYHKECDENLVEFESVKSGAKKLFEEEKPPTQNNVW